MGISELKAKCLAVVSEVARTGEPVMVTRHGKALARVVPSPIDDAAYPQDTLRGSVEILGDIVGPVLPAREWEANTDGVVAGARKRRAARS